MLQSAYIVNPIMDNNFASILNLTPVGRASDSKTQHKASHVDWLGLDIALSVSWTFRVPLVVCYCSGFSLVLFDIPGISRCQYVVSVEPSSLIHYWSYP